MRQETVDPAFGLIQGNVTQDTIQLLLRAVRRIDESEEQNAYNRLFAP